MRPAAFKMLPFASTRPMIAPVERLTTVPSARTWKSPAEIPLVELEEPEPRTLPLPDVPCTARFRRREFVPPPERVTVVVEPEPVPKEPDVP